MSHPYINLLLEAPDPCFVCGGRFDGSRDTPDGPMPGERSAFVELKVQGGDPVAPGAILTQHDEPGRTVTKTRDPVSGEAVSVSVAHPQVCSACIRVMGNCIRLGDTSLVEREQHRERQRADAAEKRVQDLAREIAELREGTRIARLVGRVLEAETAEKAKTTTRKATA